MSADRSPDSSGHGPGLVTGTIPACAAGTCATSTRAAPRWWSARPPHTSVREHADSTGSASPWHAGIMPRRLVGSHCGQDGSGDRREQAACTGRVPPSLAATLPVVVAASAEDRLAARWRRRDRASRGPAVDTTDPPRSVALAWPPARTDVEGNVRVNNAGGAYARPGRDRRPATGSRMFPRQTSRSPCSHPALLPLLPTAGGGTVVTVTATAASGSTTRRGATPRRARRAALTETLRPELSGAGAGHRSIADGVGPTRSRCGGSRERRRARPGLSWAATPAHRRRRGRCIARPSPFRCTSRRQRVVERWPSRPVTRSSAARYFT
jgi:hypothetical protein